MLRATPQQPDLLGSEKVSSLLHLSNNLNFNLQIAKVLYYLQLPSSSMILIPEKSGHGCGNSDALNKHLPA